MIKVVIVSIVLITTLVSYDITLGKRGNPSLYAAPQVFCSYGWAAITLPPLGIFVCPKYTDNQSVKIHEHIHWNQYQQMGTLGFYGTYISGWIIGGFNYENNWMEKDAYERSKGTAI